MSRQTTTETGRDVDGRGSAGTSDLDRSRPPAPGKPRLFTFPEVERHRLPGGPEVLIARRPGLPMVALELIAPAGAERDPSGAAGLAWLTAELLDEGTRSSKAEEIAWRADRLGSSLSTGAGWHVGYASIQTLTPYLERGLELMAEVTTTASLPASELERLRREQETELIKRRDRPGLQATDRLHRVLYGDTPYGHPVQGTEESLEHLDRARVLDFYRRHYRAAGTALLAVGDLDAETLLPLAEKLLGGGESETVAPPPAIDALPRDGVTFHVVDRPGATQTEIRMGYAGLSRLDPDFVAFSVLNMTLGGKFTSRINLNLRERHGYTYGASSRQAIRRGPAPFSISSAVATESTGAAVREVLAEMERLRQEPVSAQELEESRDYLIGVFPYTLQSLDGVMRRIENLVIFGLPDDFYRRYPELLAEVDRETLLRMARRHLHPDRMAVVAAGPAEVLRPQFEELDLGPVEVVPQDTD